MWWNCWFWVLNNIHTYIRTSSIPFLWDCYCALGFFFFPDMTAALRAAEILVTFFPQDAVQWEGSVVRSGVRACRVPWRLPPRWPGGTRGALVPSAHRWRCSSVCLGAFSWMGGWVWCVLVLNTIPEVALLSFICSITIGKYWIFDVCLAESFPSSVFGTTCFCLITAWFPVTFSSLTTCCSPSTNEMMSLIHW